MNTIQAVLTTVAEELAAKAKAFMPALREDEQVLQESFVDGVYRRVTTCREDVFDFRIGR